MIKYYVLIRTVGGDYINPPFPNEFESYEEARSNMLEWVILYPNDRFKIYKAKTWQASSTSITSGS